MNSMLDISEFLKEHPERIAEYIAYKEQCIRNKANLAFNLGLSLDAYEEKMQKEALELLQGQS
jgi:hypothetical protein